MISLLALSLLSAAPPDVELIGEMDSESLMVVYSQLGKVMGGDKKKDVTLRISSPGGDGIATLLFIDQVQDMKARQGARVTCIASVMAASAAAILFESPVCDKRLSMPATVFLFHGVRSGAQGKTGEIADTLDLLRGLDLAVASMIAPRLGMTPREYIAWIDRRDRWLTPSELSGLGGLDGIVGSAPEARAQPKVVAAPAPPVLAPAVSRAREWALAHLFHLKVAAGVLVAASLGWLTAWLLSPLPEPVPVRIRRRRRKR